jgi:hypothetical protein
VKAENQIYEEKSVSGWSCHRHCCFSCVVVVVPAVAAGAIIFYLSYLNE